MEPALLCNPGQMSIKALGDGRDRLGVVSRIIAQPIAFLQRVDIRPCERRFRGT